MKDALKIYRVPMAATVLIVAALGFWAYLDWLSFGEHIQERERHRALGVSRMLAGAINALEENGRLGRDEIESILEHIIEASPYQFLVLEENGKHILQAGKIPQAMTLPSTETESLSKGFYLFSRKARLLKDDGWRGGIEPYSELGDSNPLGLGDAEPLMILGGDVRDHGYPKALSHVFGPLAVAILLLTASVAAWIMVIRSRLLTEQLRTERARSAHLEDLGLAAAGLAHETKNPLGIISGIAQQIARDPEVPERSKAMLETIIDEVDKSASRLGHFMTFAKHRAIRAVPVDIQELAHRIAGVLQPEFDVAGVELKVSCAPNLLHADEDMLRQILVNLLLNSLEASSKGSSVEVRTVRQGPRAALVVADQGRGIQPELLPDIFKPYVAGNPDGHGLGLAIVKRFVEDHGWTIKAASEPNGDTVVTISGITLLHGKSDQG